MSDIFKVYNRNLESLNKLYDSLRSVKTFEGLPNMRLLPMENIQQLLSGGRPAVADERPPVEVCSLADILGAAADAPPPPPPPPPPVQPKSSSAKDDLLVFSPPQSKGFKDLDDLFR